MDESQASSGIKKHKKERSRRGCLTCRRRKVKCDEKRDVCTRCNHLSLTCVWDNFQTPRRSRTVRACDTCRQRKLRCFAIENDSTCQQCARTGSICSLIHQGSAIRHQAPISGVRRHGSNGLESRLPESHELRSILDAYFRGPHHFCFLSFIHRPSFMKMLENQLIPRPLLLVVAALGLRSMDNLSAVPNSWADECRNLIVPDIFSRISTANLQTLLLLQQFEWHRGSHLSAWFLSSLSTRLAHALQLHVEPPNKRGATELSLPPPVKETRRRLIWSCFVMDSVPDAHHSGSGPLHTSVDPSKIHTRLPCDEISYEAGIEKAGPLFSDGSLSWNGEYPEVSAALVKMVDLRRQVLRYSKGLKSQELGGDGLKPPWETGSVYDQLHQKLDEFSGSLPSGLQFPPPQAARLGPSFFTLHVMCHAAYTDLFRIGTHLSGVLRASIARIPAFIGACKAGSLEHAIALIDVISKCLDADVLEPDPFIAICSCLAIKTIVIDRWNGRTELISLEDEVVKGGLQKCLACVRKTASWSLPIRKLVSCGLPMQDLGFLLLMTKLLAVADLTMKHGYHIDVGSLKSSIMAPLTQPASRAGSPGLDTYGTLGSIRKAREEHEMESVNGTDAHDGVSPVSFPGPESSVQGQVCINGEPLHGLDEVLLQHRYSLSPDALRIASCWADGTYDLEMAQNQFVWNTADFGWDFGFDDSILGNFEAGSGLGLAPP